MGIEGIIPQSSSHESFVFDAEIFQLLIRSSRFSIARSLFV
jgi:hypothetical protein